MSVYVEDIATAVELLGEFGAIASIQPMREGESVVGKPWRVAVDLTNPADAFNAYCVIIPKSGVNAATLDPYESIAYARPVDGVSPITKECVLTDAGGKVWQIRSSDLLSPDASSVVLYTCELVKWPSV